MGSGLYGSRRFLAESKRLGVQRAVQFYQLQNFKWGDPIFLAEHVVVNDKSGEKPLSTAVGFGYFQVESLVYQLPDQVKEKIAENLTIVSLVQSSGLETRACGSYMMAGGYEVTDSLQDIVGYITEACKGCGVEPRGFKYFLRGSIHVLDDPVIIHNQPFFRGYKKIDLPDFKVTRPKGKKVLNIYNYNRRMYLKKKEREAMDSILLDEFNGGENK